MNKAEALVICSFLVLKIEQERNEIKLHKAELSEDDMCFLQAHIL